MKTATIDGYNSYVVTSCGDVINKHNKKINGEVSIHGYRRVKLSNGNKGQKFAVHRLVALAFIPNPLNKPQVNHLNGCKLDNKIENLEWCTASENELYSYRVLGKSAPSSVFKKGCKQEFLTKAIHQYSVDGELVKSWDSLSDAQRSGFQQGNITKCAQGKRKSHKGFLWSYVIKEGG